MEFFSIGEIAQKAGIAPSAIRYYERIGLLSPAERVGGKRRYDETILRKLGVIRMARQAGLTIADIQTLINEFPHDTPASKRWQTVATRKIPQLEKQIQNLQKMKSYLEETLNCQCATLDECGEKAL